MWYLFNNIIFKQHLKVFLGNKKKSFIRHRNALHSKRKKKKKKTLDTFDFRVNILKFIWKNT